MREREQKENILNKLDKVNKFARSRGEFPKAGDPGVAKVKAIAVRNGRSSRKWIQLLIALDKFNFNSSCLLAARANKKANPCMREREREKKLRIALLIVQEIF